MDRDKTAAPASTEGAAMTEDVKTGTQEATGDIQRDNGALFLQEDDEFEDFKAHDWDDGHDELTLKKTVWADTWEDDDDEEDFYDQLKKQKEGRSAAMNTD